jgi:hypothetical protein
MHEKRSKPIRRRSVPIDVTAMRRYFDDNFKKPDESLRKIMERGRIDKNHFIEAMQKNRIPPGYWSGFLPEDGIAGVEPQIQPNPGRVLVCFPTPAHLEGHTYSSLTWGGAGSNDSNETLDIPNPGGGEPLSVLPLDTSGSEPRCDCTLSIGCLALIPKIAGGLRS